MLDRLVLGLRSGQYVMLRGEQADAPGVLRTEVRQLDEPTHSGGYTILNLREALQYSYKRSSLTINANLAGGQFQVSGVGFTNHGTINVANGDSAILQPTGFTNAAGATISISGAGSAA